MAKKKKVPRFMTVSRKDFLWLMRLPSCAVITASHFCIVLYYKLFYYRRNKFGVVSFSRNLSFSCSLSSRVFISKGFLSLFYQVLLKALRPFYKNCGCNNIFAPAIIKKRYDEVETQMENCKLISDDAVKTVFVVSDGLRSDSFTPKEGEQLSCHV